MARLRTMNRRSRRATEYARWMERVWRINEVPPVAPGDTILVWPTPDGYRDQHGRLWERPEWLAHWQSRADAAS